MKPDGTLFTGNGEQPGRNSIQIVKENIRNLDADAIVLASVYDTSRVGPINQKVMQEIGYQIKEATIEKRESVSCNAGADDISKTCHIFRVVSPSWHGGGSMEEYKLYSCYQAVLNLARGKGCRRIGFQLISSGVFGFPKRLVWVKALQAVNDYFKQHPDGNMEVIFAVRSSAMPSVSTGLRYLVHHNM